MLSYQAAAARTQIANDDELDKICHVWSRMRITEA